MLDTLNTEYNNYKLSQNTKNENEIIKMKKDYENKLLDAQKTCDQRIKLTVQQESVKQDTMKQNTMKQDSYNESQQPIIQKISSSYKPGIIFNIYEGYFNENVGYTTGASLTNKFGNSSSGMVDNLDNINTGTNKIIPKYFSKPYGGFTVEWFGFIFTNNIIR